MVERGAATVLEERDMSPDAVVRELEPLLRDAALRRRRGRAARRQGRPRAADHVVDLLAQIDAGGAVRAVAMMEEGEPA
jgi:UDP-N-acetylglucosamine:LPS N-acetylglucosamine transferase